MTSVATASTKISDSVKLQWIRDFRNTNEMWQLLSNKEKRVAFDGMVGSLTEWKANPSEARDEIAHAIREASPDKFSIGALLGDIESYEKFPEKMTREELSELTPDQRLARKRQRQKARREARAAKKAASKTTVKVTKGKK